MITPILPFPDSPPALGPYSLAVQASGSFLFVSGMTPWNPATGKIERSSISEQTRLVLQNIQRILEHAGSSIDHVVSCRIYINDLTPARVSEMNRIYEQFFHSSKPARATVGVTLPGFDIEIECIALLLNQHPNSLTT